MSPATITFTPALWNVAQTVIVTGNEDFNLVNESPTITVTVVDALSDDAWDLLVDQAVAVSVSDNDVASFTVSPNTDTLLSEGSTNVALYTVNLDVQPVSDVVITLTTVSPQLTLNTSSLTFTSANWNIPQNVSVSANDDLN